MDPLERIEKLLDNGPLALILVLMSYGGAVGGIVCGFGLLYKIISYNAPLPG